jgi:hypothetical protein
MSMPAKVESCFTGNHSDISLRIFMNGTTQNTENNNFGKIRLFRGFSSQLLLVTIAYAMVLAPLSADAADESLKGQVRGLYSSFRATFAVTSPGGGIQTGKIMHQYPGKLRVETASGVIAINGTHLWVHNKRPALCARQDVRSLGGSILGAMANYKPSGFKIVETPLNN